MSLSPACPISATAMPPVSLTPEAEQSSFQEYIVGFEAPQEPSAAGGVIEGWFPYN
jgi:hypothetical protein